MNAHTIDAITLRRQTIRRRRFLQSSAAGIGAFGLRGTLTARAAEMRQRGKAVIVLWMQGGPSQFETWDPKPNHRHGGGTKAISTSVDGIQLAEHLPNIAEQMEHIAVIRSMTGKEGSHPRATYQMHTGYIPSGSIKHPSLGSCVTQQLGDLEAAIPAFVSIGNTAGAGFLGMDYEPFNVRTPGNLPDNLEAPVDRNRLNRRLGLLSRIDGHYASAGAEAEVQTHQSLYTKASGLIRSSENDVFEFADEPASLVAEYGDTDFGRGCLLARRLVERGVTYVEVRGGNWDTHDNNFERVAENAGAVDPATAALIRDLHDRGRLQDTLIVWMGEFGRTPQVNPRGGRDHFPRVFSLAMAGGGVRGGQVIGGSSPDGTEIADSPVTVNDLFRSVCTTVGADPDYENISPLGRPMKVVDGGQLIPGLLG